MRKVLLCFFLLGILGVNAQTAEDKKYNILLTGASFASSNNGWFELGCKYLDANPINKAIPGEAIADAANHLIKGEFYTNKELENIDAFVIMQVHDKDVAGRFGLKEKYQDYPIPFDRSNYAAGYDYVIKRYISDCYNLKFDKDSKYYNTKSGKPAIIVLCTHWHDARTIYNPAIRVLAARWGFPLVEFDKYIGFSKDSLHPVTGSQYSLIYSRDTEKVNGEEFGWHPADGQDKYIQQRMAAIFAQLMRTVLPLK